MCRKIIDAHIHLDMYEPVECVRILDDMEASNVDAVISVSNHLVSARETIQLAHDNYRVKPAIGFHPEQPIASDEEVGDLLSMIDCHKEDIVAVGEVGLPFYLRREGKVSTREAYRETLEVFIQKAAELDKPIALHAIYDDAPVVCDLLEKYSAAKAHFHWFKGDKLTAERMVANGYFISVTPDILYEKETRDLAKEYPLGKMMVETDGPWPFGGIFSEEMTHPHMIHRSVYEVSALKRTSADEVYKRLYDNTCRFYEL